MLANNILAAPLRVHGTKRSGLVSNQAKQAGQEKRQHENRGKKHAGRSSLGQAIASIDDDELAGDIGGLARAEEGDD